MRRNPGKEILWGYYPDPEDPDYIIANPDELAELACALTHLHNGHSLRRVAVWLSARTGRSISHVGLRDRLHRELKLQRDKRKLTAAEDLNGAPTLVAVEDAEE